jgi:sulfate transport system permease protein
MTARRGLRAAALGYLALLLLIPVGLVIYRTFEPGVGAVWDSVTTPAAISAFWLTLEIAAIAVTLNTVMGVVTALLLVRGRFRGKWIIEALLDLPFAVSPVVVGLSLVLVYGRGGWLADLPFQVIFSLPGMVLATVFVSLPFVAREVIPVLREVGDEQEQAAATLGASGWQTFRRITLPAIRWGVAYGVILSTARAIGEFGAVSVVSGHIRGQTNTVPLHVEILYNEYNFAAAFAVASLLTTLSIVTLVVRSIVEWRASSAVVPEPAGVEI